MPDSASTLFTASIYIIYQNMKSFEETCFCFSFFSFFFYKEKKKFRGFLRANRFEISVQFYMLKKLTLSALLLFFLINLLGYSANKNKYKMGKSYIDFLAIPRLLATKSQIFIRGRKLRSVDLSLAAERTSLIEHGDCALSIFSGFGETPMCITFAHAYAASLPIEKHIAH